VTGGQAMTADFLELLKKPTGQSKLVSCDVGEYSYEHAELGGSGHGVFTYAVLEALRGGAAADDQNVVRLSSVASYVNRSVASWTAEQNLRRRPGDPEKKQSPSYQGPETARELPLAKKAGDLAALVASVRRQPTTDSFTNELRSQLAEKLLRLDPRQDADQELLAATRDFVNGKMRVAVFAPYLRGELDRRGKLPSRMVRATFIVRDGSEDDSPLASDVVVELQWQGTGNSDWTSLGKATTDSEGRASLELAGASLPTSAGRYYARVSQGSREKNWSLEGFPATTSWRLYLPRLVRKAGDVVTSPKGIKLAYIPAGEFMMGSDESAANLEAAGIVLSDPEEISGESPAHKVTISRPFLLGVHEVTKGQFAAFVEDTGYRTETEQEGRGGWGYDATEKFSVQAPQYNWRNTGWPQSEDHPVVNVSWNDAVAFCNWLSRTEGRTECYSIEGTRVVEVYGDGYRLPREAEWEYACRADTRTRYVSGDHPNSLAGFGNVRDASYERAASAGESSQSFFTFDDRWAFTSRCGEFKPNRWGLHDMTGNVMEWCQDWFHEYPHGIVTDPKGPMAGTARAIRGGAWRCGGASCFRTANRESGEPDFASCLVGFRVVLSQPRELTSP